jgi:hypothetical protein
MMICRFDSHNESEGRASQTLCAICGHGGRLWLVQGEYVHKRCAKKRQKTAYEIGIQLWGRE